MTTGTAIAGVTPATTTWADVSPPEYYPLPAYVEGAQLPTTFKVGTQYTVPLISISSVKTYLLLLGAFHGLKQRVLNAPYDHLVPPPSNAVKWLIFLCRARNRFELWVERIVKRRERATREWTTLHREEIPPLDVCMHELPSPCKYCYLTCVCVCSTILSCLSVKPVSLA